MRGAGMRGGPAFLSAAKLAGYRDQKRKPKVKIITTLAEMQCRSDAIRRAGKRIAFIPTMGFLHEGHLSLMREGRRRAEVVVASIFVNPTQFAPNEDFGRYPRAFERDCEMMKEVPVDLVFAPE